MKTTADLQKLDTTRFSATNGDIGVATSAIKRAERTAFSWQTVSWFFFETQAAVMNGYPIWMTIALRSARWVAPGPLRRNEVLIRLK